MRFNPGDKVGYTRDGRNISNDTGVIVGGPYVRIADSKSYDENCVEFYMVKWGRREKEGYIGEPYATEVLLPLRNNNDCINVYHIEDIDRTPISLPRWIADAFDEFRYFDNEGGN